MDRAEIGVASARHTRLWVILNNYDLYYATFYDKNRGEKTKIRKEKKRAKRLDIRIQKNTNKQRLKIQKRDKDTNSRMSEWEEKTSRDREEERG